MAKILITSALPYVNNVPHLGNLIGSTLSADVYARHARLRGDDVLYVCGGDDHGTTTEIKALEEKVTPEELCNKYNEIHKKVYDWFGISFDVWGRTHTETGTKIVQDIFLRLHEKGLVHEKESEQLFDEKSNMFLADRFVEGECTSCGAEGARGDQCDTCNTLLNAVDLINPVSKISGTAPVVKKTTHLYLDLPALKPKIQAFFDEKKESWSNNTVKVTEQWLADLHERAITRDLKWGIRVPIKGYEEKVFYVWFDAPIGYITITAHARDDWEDWWKDPNVKLVQFMGKDNIVFHSVIFPGVLLGTEDNWTLVESISTTEYLNMKDTKFSKSKGTGVFGEDCIALEQEYGIGADVWRYYLISQRPETSDTVFSWSDFQEKTNNELLANFGNLVQRTLHFAATKLQGIAPTEDYDYDGPLAEDMKLLEKARQHLDNQEMRAALKTLMQLSKQANVHFQNEEPWKHVKDNPEKAAATVYSCLSVLRDIAIHLQPIIPFTAETILDRLGVEDRTYEGVHKPLPKNIFDSIEKPTPLFKKIEDEHISAFEERFSGTTHPLDLRVAKIIEVNAHPNADKLYMLKLDLGEEQRTIISGIKDHYTQKKLQGKHIIVACNLEPAKLRGELSEGMLLAGEQDGVVGLLTAPKAEPGARLTIGGKKGADTLLAFKDFQKHTIVATQENVTIDGARLEGAEFVLEKEVYGPLR